MALAAWIEFFEDLQLVRGRSKNTVLAYRRDLELYEQFLSTRQPASAVYDFMKKHGLSVRSQARVISSVRTYLKFCETQGISSPQLLELRPPKVKVKLPKTLSLEEFDLLFRACEVPDPIRTARNHMTLLLLYGLGCRVSELIDLDLMDINEADQTIKITGKGQKQRIVPLTSHLSGNLAKYLREIRPQLVNDQSGHSLIINDRNHRPSRVDIWRWLASWSARAGFPEPVSPHRFRHACATALLEGGADLRSIQLLLGHASLQTTQIYTNVTTQALVRTIEDHHPLSQNHSDSKK